MHQRPRFRARTAVGTGGQEGHMQARAALSRLLPFLALCLFLAGCGAHSNLPVSIQALSAIALALKKKRFLQFGPDDPPAPGKPPRNEDGQREDRQKAFFIFRRGASILSRHPELASDQTALTTKIEAQLSAVETFLAVLTEPPSGTLTTPFEPGGQSTATNTDPFQTSIQFHIDLADAATPLVGRPPSAERVSRYVRDRINAARTIVWRTAAMHDELWSNNGDDAPLNSPALREALDRRLRAVERMRFQVNGLRGRAPVPVPGAPDAGGRGPWSDDSRIRVFEYPYFPISIVDPSDIGPAGVWTPFPDDPTVTPSVVQYELRRAGQRPIITRFNPERPPPPVTFSTDWPILAGNYFRDVAGTPPSAALDLLLQSSLDVWQRAWLFCDHSIATLHLEALRFGLARRSPGNLGQFDNVLAQKHAIVGPLLGDIAYDAAGKPVVPDRPGTLFQDASSTRVIDNLFLNLNDLEVGDHAILWNHHLYLFVTSGAWRLENAFVTELDVDVPVDPASGRIEEPRIAPTRLGLAGFGEEWPLPAFRQKLFDNFRADFANVYDQIDALAPGTTAFINPRSAARALVFRWEPFQPLGLSGSPGPWFIFLSRISPGDGGSVWPDVATMLKVIQHSFVDDPTLGADHNALQQVTFNPPFSVNFSDGVLFPLFVPVLNNKVVEWPTYLAARRGNPSLQGSLRRIKIDAKIVPALEVRGVQNPIQVIRPRATP